MADVTSCDRCGCTFIRLSFEVGDDVCPACRKGSPMTLDQYEVAVANAIAVALGRPADLWAKGIEMGRTVLREADYDLDTAHGEMLTPEQAAAEALDEFGAVKRAQREG